MNPSIILFVLIIICATNTSITLVAERYFALFIIVIEKKRHCKLTSMFYNELSEAIEGHNDIRTEQAQCKENAPEIAAQVSRAADENEAEARIECDENSKFEESKLSEEVHATEEVLVQEAQIKDKAKAEEIARLAEEQRIKEEKARAEAEVAGLDAKHVEEPDEENNEYCDEDSVEPCSDDEEPSDEEENDGYDESFDLLKREKESSFTEHKVIGSGNYGTVYRAKTHSGLNVAIKEPNESRVIDDVKYEMLLLNELNHINILRFYSYYISRQGRLCMVTEYIDGITLSQLISYNPPESMIIAIAGKLLNAIKYIHSLLVIHRDIKPDNIIISKDGELKLLDFGVSRELNEENPTCEDTIGTLSYMAPEVARGDEYVTKADIFSFGMTIYECIHKHIPQKSEHYFTTLKRIGKQGRPEMNMSLLFSKDLFDLVEAATVFDPEERGDVDAMLEHQIFSHYAASNEEIASFIQKYH